MRCLVLVLSFALANTLLVSGADELSLGSAAGSLTYHGQTVNLTFAGAFVNTDDDKKQTILVLSDQKLPVEKWSSESDLMRDETKWSGVVFFLNGDGTFGRSDIRLQGRQAIVSGFFGMQWSDPGGKTLSGRAATDPSAKENKLEVVFRAERP